MRNRLRLSAPVSLLAFALTACGGGGGGGVASIPPPPVTQPGALTPQQVVIFPKPHAETYAAVGVATTLTGSGESLGFGSLSKADSAQVHIRYASGGYYEIMMPGSAWETLDFAKGVIPADPANANQFQPQSAPQGGAEIVTSISRTDGYQYSELAGWFDGSGRAGEFAFGEATPAGGVPQTGSATYHGIVQGTSDVTVHDLLSGNFRAPVDGTVNLSFDFGKGSLSGAMTLTLDGYNPTPLGTFSFTDTVLSAGSYSGKFDTGVAGDNFFLGQFTGPNAEETIGAWALPFLYGGDDHQAFGAWIAKQTP